MIKVEIMSVYGQGAMGSKYWTYNTTVLVKGSVKRALDHAHKVLWEKAKDREGFNWIPVIHDVKVYNGSKLVMEIN